MPHVDSPRADSVGAGAPALQIEITPAMIRAGTAALSRLLPDECGWATAESYVEAVLKAALEECG
jgi:hypothetical protein